VTGGGYGPAGGKAIAVEARLNALIGATGPWTDMRPLANSFVGTISGQYPPQWRVSFDGFIEVAGWVQLPASAGNLNNIAFYTIPSAYKPGSNGGHRWPVAGVAAGVAPPCCQVDSTGAFKFFYMPTASIGSTVVSIYGRYPLDSAGLILV
jgi:hypothetical protein